MSTIANNNNMSEAHGNNNNLLRKHLKRLQSSPTEALILDGGTGEELFLRGVPDDRKIWSAKAIVDAQYHSILEEVHRSFIDAGSEAITTKSISKALQEIKSNPHIHQYLQHPIVKPLESPILQSKDEPFKIFLGAYANSLTPVDPEWTMESSEEAQPMREDLSPEKYWEEFVKLWHSANSKEKEESNEYKVKNTVVDEIGGVQLIGGCCGIGPSHISVLKKHLKEQNE